MYRLAEHNLQRWKENPHRRPLLMRGPRQVGKTRLMQSFGKRFYETTLYIDFETEERFRAVFGPNINPHHLVRTLSEITGSPIEPGKTLLIFDNIDACPRAFRSLKYFREEAPQYHVIAAGSRLGTFRAPPHTWPVGCIGLMDIDPMTFAEFLRAVHPDLFACYASVLKGERIDPAVHTRLTRACDEYMAVGGMPACVASWAETRDAAKIHSLQTELLNTFRREFTLENLPAFSRLLAAVFESLIPQLEKGSGIFRRDAVDAKTRRNRLEAAVEWLTASGFVMRVNNVRQPSCPLPAYDRPESFRLFSADTGLLRTAAPVCQRVSAQNYVLQQLLRVFSTTPRFFTDERTKADFLFQHGCRIVAAEVVSGEEPPTPAFLRFLKEHKPDHAVVFSKRPYRTENSITNIPLWLAGKTKDLL